MRPLVGSRTTIETRWRCSRAADQWEKKPPCTPPPKPPPPKPPPPPRPPLPPSNPVRRFDDRFARCRSPFVSSSSTSDDDLTWHQIERLVRLGNYPPRS